MTTDTCNSITAKVKVSIKYPILSTGVTRFLSINNINKQLPLVNIVNDKRVFLRPMSLAAVYRYRRITVTTIRC